MFGSILSPRQTKLLDLVQTPDSHTLLFLVVGSFPDPLTSGFLYIQVMHPSSLLSNVEFYANRTQLHSLDVSFLLHFFVFFFRLIM